VHQAFARLAALITLLDGRMAVSRKANRPLQVAASGPERALPQAPTCYICRS